METVQHSNTDLFDTLTEIYETLEGMTNEEILQIRDLSLSYPELGPRLAMRAGDGLEFLGLRPFDPYSDPVAVKSARHSARNSMNPVAVEREVEKKHHIGIWWDPRMNYQIEDGKTAEQEARIIALALGLKLAGDDDHVSVIKDDQRHVITQTSQHADHLHEVSLMADTVPEIGSWLPAKSSVFLIGNFYDEEETQRMLNDLADHDLKAYLIKVMHPWEVTLDLPRNVRVSGLKDEFCQTGESHLDLSDPARAKEIWQKQFADHLRRLEDMCAEKDFSLDGHLTDGSPVDVIDRIYERLAGNPDERPDWHAITRNKLTL